MKTSINLKRIHVEDSGWAARLLTRRPCIMARQASAALFFVLAASCGAQQTTTVSVPAPTQYAVTSMSLNSQTWQRTTYEQLPSGEVIPHVDSYIEAASGLNFLGANGQLQSSKPEIDILPNGSGQAIYGQHQAYWPADISSDAIELIEPGGAQLLSQPLSICYYDGASYVDLADLTNSVGELISSNQILYPEAFGTEASILYSYTKAGVEQFIIINEQLPTPQSLGLNPETTRLEALTEFFNAPEPTVSASTVSTSAGDIESDGLTFGTMSMEPGKAFMLGTAMPSVNIERQWVTQNGRQILIEELPAASISDQLANLPLPKTSSRKSRSLVRVASAKLQLPPQKHWRTSRRNPAVQSGGLGKGARIARATSPGRGFVLDYTIVNGNMTNYTFQGDSTIYISSELALFGTNNLMEGGAVIKLAKNASIVVEGNSPGTSVKTFTGNARPAIITSSDDNTIGVEISGSTGTPSGYYGNPALEISGTEGSPGVLNNLRISYAQTGIQVNQQTADLFNVQLMDCGTGCEVVDGSATFENALFGNVTNSFSVDSSSEAAATNATFSGSFTLSTGSGSISLGNCILANVTNNGSATLSADYDGFYDSTGFGSDRTTAGAWPFEVIGGGSYYLTNGCVFRNAGTTNIDPVLLAALQSKTTWPPVVYDRTNISAFGILGPYVPRDINVSADLGWHYDPIDYAFGGCDSSNQLTVTAGTTIGIFGDSASGWPYGIRLENGGGLSFLGNATQPCMFVFADMVQEGDNGSWTAGEGGGYLGGFVWNGTSTGPEPMISANFTKWIPDSYRGLFQDNPGYGAGNFKNCEFYNSSGSAYKIQYLTFTNCLFFRNFWIFWDSDYAINFTNENCTYYNGGLALARLSGQAPSFWLIENTAFDGTALAWNDYYHGSLSQTFFDYNSYNTNNLSWQSYSIPYFTCYGTNEVVGPDDLMTTNYGWQTSWFGNFYLPPSPYSPLIDAGSTTADLFGLYHFTTQTNQSIEGTSPVDIGYHYVATDSNGNPLDSNSDGIPDYLEDANGNGTMDSGEIGWNYTGDLGLTVLITQPPNGSTLP